MLYEMVGPNEDLSTSRHSLTTNRIPSSSGMPSSTNRNSSTKKNTSIYQSKKFLFSLKAAAVGSIGGLLFGYDLGVISGRFSNCSIDNDISN
jgi:hypothetical protein